MILLPNYVSMHVWRQAFTMLFQQPRSGDCTGGHRPPLQSAFRKLHKWNFAPHSCEPQFFFTARQ